MVLMNATKKARMTDSYRLKADNRCNGGMKKAGQAMYCGWMRSGYAVPENIYKSRTSKNFLYINPKNGVSCFEEGSLPKVLKNRPVLPLGLKKL